MLPPEAKQAYFEAMLPLSEYEVDDMEKELESTVVESEVLVESVLLQAENINKHPDNKSNLVYFIFFSLLNKKLKLTVVELSTHNLLGQGYSP